MARLLALVFVLLCGSLAGVESQQAPQVFRSGVDAVRVDVLATHNGRPVPNLSASDFEVLDNGVPQQVTLLDVGAVPIVLMLGLDVSESVAGDRLRALVAACRTAIGALRPIDSVSVVSFSHEITERVPLSGAGDYFSALDAIAGSGNTSLYDAVYAGILLGTASDSRTVFLVFSDGRDTSSWLLPSMVVDAAKRSGVVIYGVTIQPPVESPLQQLRQNRRPKPSSQRLTKPGLPDFLEQITTLTGGRVLRAEQPDLPRQFSDIIDEFTNRYLLSYTPTGVTDRGWHDITVRVPTRAVDIRCRRGYRS